MENKKQSLWKDMIVPLDKIESPWLRRSTLILSTIPLIAVGIVGGMLFGIGFVLYHMYKDCW